MRCLDGAAKEEKQIKIQNLRKDYRKELNYMFAHFDEYFDTPHKRKIAKSYRNFYITVMNIADDREIKKLYESLMAGDPKLRNLRALYQNVYSRYVQEAKKEAKNNG